MKANRGPLIISAKHRATLAQANSNCAKAAAESAAKHAVEGDTYRAAGAARTGLIYLRRAAELTSDLERVGETTLNLIRARLETERSLNRTLRAVEESLEGIPLDPETVLYYATLEQNLTTLAEVEIIDAAIAKAAGKNKTLETALVGTMEYLVIQPPIHDDHEAASSRPEAEEEGQEAVRVSRAKLSSRRSAWQEQMEINHSPLALAARTGYFDAGEVSPVLPTTLAYRMRPPGVLTPDESLCLVFVAFHHENAIYVKALNEPYPDRFPQDRATAIALINQETIADILGGNNEFTPAESRQLTIQGDRALALAEAGLHTSEFTGPNDAADALREAGAEGGTARLIAKHLTAGKPALTDMAGRDGPASVDANAADAVLEEARAQGLDPTTIRWIAHAMGQPQTEEGAGHRLTTRQREALIEAAKKAGITREQAENAARKAEDYF